MVVGHDGVSLREGVNRARVNPDLGGCTPAVPTFDAGSAGAATFAAFARHTVSPRAISDALTRLSQHVAADQTFEAFCKLPDTFLDDG